MLRLEFPNESHKAQWEEMFEEWRKYESIPTSPWLLFKGENFEEFLDYVQHTSQWGYNGKTQSTLYFWIVGDKIIWAIDIRHNIIHPSLRDYSGHIGYWVRPSERGKWYATQMLALWLIEAKKLWIEKVLISCHPDNPVSQKVILKNGWVYEKTVCDEKWWEYMRHWIEL